jgi:4-hydroxy-tetrahydrodipicolinate synthase
MLQVKLERLKKKISGPIQTIFVPFTKNFKIDYKSLKNHIHILCKMKHVNVLYLMPYNGRYSLLHENEIFELNYFCIKEVKKFKKLIIVSDPIHASTERKLEFCLHAKKNGADIFSSICREKFFSDEQIFLHYKKIASANFPILVHIMPFLSGYNDKNLVWSFSIIKKISKLKNVIAFKEDTKSVEYGKQVLKQFKNRFSIIFAGRKKLFLKLRDSGLTSYLNGTSIIDSEIDEIFWYYFKNNKSKALRFVKEIDDPFWDTLSSKYGWHRLNKACLEINGIMNRYERLPMISLNNKEYKDVKEKIISIKNKLNTWKKNFRLEHKE